MEELEAEEEEKEEEEEEPKPVKVSDIVEVFDPEKREWFSARWTIYSPGVENYFAPIDIAGPKTLTIIRGPMDHSICITCIILTADDETSVTLLADDVAISGPMDFGGAGEPKGLTNNFGAHYLQLPKGSSFRVSVSDVAQVSGMVTYVLR